MTPIADVLPRGAWPGPPVDRVELDHEGRHRRHVVLTGISGTEYLLDLAEATALRDGDGLILPAGGIVQVVAKAEPLMEVRAAGPAELVRLAWRIGARRLAAALEADRILIRRDPEVGLMLERQGAVVRDVEAVFEPEGGTFQDP